MPEDDPARTPVTDEERNRFGALLDRAAERGLLSATDYESRLRELASAATTEEMVAIVTDLPVLRASAPARRGSEPRAPSPAVAVESGSRRWLALVVLVVVVVVSLVVLGLVVSHLHRPSPSGAPGPRGTATTTAAISAPRL